MTRVCKICSANIAERHYHAVLCFSCLFGWQKRTGAGSAYHKVAKAVKSGALPAAKECLCVDCGAKASVYDHRDYSKPLEVQPVCQSCNKLRGPGLAALSIAQSAEHDNGVAA